MEEEVHETYLQDMNSKYVYPNVFMSIDDTNKVSYLKKMEKYGLSDYLSIKQKYFDQYQKSVSEEK